MGETFSSSIRDRHTPESVKNLSSCIFVALIPAQKAESIWGIYHNAHFHQCAGCEIIHMLHRIKGPEASSRLAVSGSQKLSGRICIIIIILLLLLLLLQHIGLQVGTSCYNSVQKLSKNFKIKIFVVDFLDRNCHYKSNSAR